MNERLNGEYDKDFKIKVIGGIDNEEKQLNNKLFKNNKISTTKYNLITFLPKSLLLQFRRIANIYFLIISILTCMSFSPKNPVTMIGTFAIVLIFTMIKEGYEDMKRYKQDKEQNSKKAKVFNHEMKDYDIKNWEDLKVGDALYLSKNEGIPADLLLFKSSLDSGMCFVDTMNLDGETNLKEKLCPQGTKDIQKSKMLYSLSNIICDKPNEILDKWECSFYYDNSSIPIICGPKQLLLRGCTLKNTDWVIGLVIYTGHDTKILRNAKNPPIKMSNVMLMMNSLLYSVFFFQIILCFVFSVSFVVWQKNNSGYLPYLSIYSDSFEIIQDAVDTGDLFIKILTFLVAYSHLIPISLYVALEIVKLIQSMLISYDAKMIDPNTNNSALARTSDLIEEMGQVEFIFSDKTGTLTKNEMEFRKCFINNKVYGETDNSNKKAKYTINGDALAFNILSSTDNDQLLQDKILIEEFFTALAVCHSAFVEEKDNIKNYQSSSPDEVALLQGAEQIGFEFTKRTSETIEIATYAGVYQIWELILELPFDSTRKRMSVIVRQTNGKDNNCYLYTKGADTAMLPNMDMTEKNIELVKANLNQFAQEGLRTLVIGKRVMSEKEKNDIIVKYNKICSSGDKDKEKYLSVLFDEVEKGLAYIGSSGIEDKLQDETAIEIGKSCRLILPETIMEAISLASESDKDDSQAEFKSRLERAYEKYVINAGSQEKQNFPSFKNKTDQKKKMYMIIDGKNLAYVLGDEELSDKFFKVGLLANSVICCRVSPKQKSLVVALAKNNKKCITLSIGDGANDVPMIMEAHIGIGISGKEGTQAVRSADYAIGQFRFLQRLLLIHGRWGYRRISLFICYYFYKNIVTVFTELYFAIFNGFSGQIFFPDLLPLCYNAFWTSWPCIFAYSIEKDVDENISFQFPKLYNAGQQKFYFSLKKFWIWIVFALLHGVVIFFFITYGFESASSSDAVIPDHWLKSTTAFTVIINIVTLKIFIDSMYWNKLNIAVGIMSLLFYYFCLLIFCVPNLSQVLQNELMDKLYMMISNYKMLVSLIFIPLIALLPDASFKLIQSLFWPSPIEFLINEQLHNRKDEFNKKSADESKEINLSNMENGLREREMTINNETQKKFLTNSIRQVESINKFSTTNLNDKKKFNYSKADFIVENVLLQNFDNKK